MSSKKHLELGAVNKNTNRLEHACYASKINDYMCVMCHEDIIFRYGIVNIPHFAHKSNSICSFFNRCIGGETEQHIKCKSVIKLYL